jgi:hypothetical protein
MSDEKQFDEKNEKELEKHDEKTEERDRLSSIAWAFALMWAGLVFLASNMGWFEQLGLDVNTRWGFMPLANWRSFGVWNLIAIGAGAIFLIEAVARLVLPAYRRDIVGSFIGAAVLLMLGFGGWINWQIIWPFLVIIAGISILISGTRRQRK